MFKKRSTLLLTAIWLVVVTAVISSTLTLLIARESRNADGGAWVSSETLTALQRYSKLEEIRNIIDEHYYQDVSEDVIMRGAAQGMMAALDDPYSFYYAPDDMREMNEETTGVYKGVGMMVSMTEEGYIRVLRVFKSSPAELAGVQAGDIITHVDGTPVSGVNAKEFASAISMIRGEYDTEVRLTLRRSGQAVVCDIMRSEVNINYVEYSIIDGEIGYLLLYQFMGDDISGVAEAISAFKSAGVKGVVIDVRSNPGGLLSDVVSICDMFLPEGLIVYTQDGTGKRDEYYSSKEYWDIPLAVLVNGSSASASEIFAAAVQDFKRGVVVGETTYGKGVVQTLISFSEGGDGLQLTTSAYFTSDGRSINGVGVEPDIAVAHSDDFDAQLKAAIEALTESY